ncbi:MAG: hypothetical protein ACREAK_06445 [Nitrosarchaeum sp.]
MSLYDAEQPRKSIDLLTEVILNSNRTIYCHYFMECGKKATKQIALNGKQINVCDDHFKEIN